MTKEATDKIKYRLPTADCDAVQKFHQGILFVVFNIVPNLSFHICYQLLGKRFVGQAQVAGHRFVSDFSLVYI